MKKVQIASFALLGATALLVVSIGTTTAWYLGSSYLQAGTYDVKIGAKEVKISTDNFEFKDEINKEDFDNPVDLFKPVSSMYSEMWLESKATMPMFRDSYVPSENTIAGVPGLAENGFFSAPLYFRADSDCDLLIDPKGCTFTPVREDNLRTANRLRSQYPGMSVEEIADLLDTVVKSLRVSFLVLNDTGSTSYKDYGYYIIDPYKYEEDPETHEMVSHETYYGGCLDADGDKYFDISTTNQEVFYGQYKNGDKLVYNEPTDEDTSYEGIATCFNARHNGKARTINFEESFEQGFEIAKENSLGLDDVQSPVNGFKVPLSRNISKEVIFSIYLEGWDLDNTNITMNSHFALELSFAMQSKH